MENEIHDVTIISALAEQFYNSIISSAAIPPNSFIFFIDGSIPVSAEHMKWIGETSAATRDDANSFARIANIIPAIGQPWSRSTNLLGPIYRSWLDNAVVPATQLSADDERKLREAKERISEGAELYYQYEERWLVAQKAWQEAVHGQTHDLEHQRQVLAAKQAMDRALLEWQVRGGKSRFEAAFAVQEHYLSLSQGLQSALKMLREDYDNVFTMNSTRTGEHFTPVRLIPPDPFSNEASWTPFLFQVDNLSPAQTRSGVSYSGALDIPIFWNATSDAQRTRINDINPVNMVLSFELLYTQIDRSAWFDSLLLNSNSWWWSGATQSQPTSGGPVFSNGVPPPGTQGEWQMTSAGIICMRNLIVVMDNFDLATSGLFSQAAETAGCWIFTIRTADSPLAAGFDFELEGGSILRAPQTQIAALVYQLMPKEPNPDIALLPNS